jgi:hypothetical protein
VDEALNRLFTQDLPIEEAEPLIEELRPIAATLAPSLVTLLNSPDRRTRSTASALLSTFAEPAAVPLLRQLLDSTGASDEAKLSAYSVLQTLGETLDPIQFLRKLRDPDALFAHGIEDLLELLRQDGELAQLGDLLQTMPPEGLVDLLGEVGARCDPGTLKLFTTSLWAPHPEVAAAAIAQLRQLRDPRGVDSLLDLAAISRRPELAELARAAALELRMRDSYGGGAPSPPEGRAGRCHASFIDGSGSQMLVLATRAESSPGRTAALLLNDERGLDDCFGSDAADEERLRELMGGAEARGLGWVAVDLGYCRARVAQSLRLNARRHRPLPWSFEIWRDLLGPECHPDEGETTFPCRELPAEEMKRCLPRTGDLFRRTEFSSWMLSPADLASFLPGPSRGASRPGRSRAESRSRRTLSGGGEEEAGIAACLRQVATRRARTRWRARLLANGWLWERSGDAETALLCRVAAAALEERAGLPPEEHPFLRRMAQLSFQEALAGRA